VLAGPIGVDAGRVADVARGIQWDEMRGNGDEQGYGHGERGAGGVAL